MHHPQTNELFSIGPLSVAVPSKLLRVCAWCKRVEGCDGSWSDMESISKELKALPKTHGMCPTCMRSFLAIERKVVSGRKGGRLWAKPLKAKLID